MNNNEASGDGEAREEKVRLLENGSSSESDSEDSFAGSEALLSSTSQRPKYWRYVSAAMSPLQYLQSVKWKALLFRTAIFLTPSFLQGPKAREQIRPPKLSPTAYLDGMRGLAALFVFFCHYFYQAFTIAKGWGNGEENRHFLKLPFLRLWYQGPPAVCVFFVISGYALSYRPLKLLRSGATADFATTMSSLTFRRGIRLYLPTAISTFMIITLLRLGAYELTRGFANDRKYMKNIIENHPVRMESAYAQYRDWVIHMFRFVHVFGWDKYGGSTSELSQLHAALCSRLTFFSKVYDVHLWTIPVEFRCSLYLFLVLIGTARLRTMYRFMSVGGILWFTYRHSRWELCLFYCGMLLAELDHIRGAHIPAPALPQTEKTPSRSCTRFKGVFWALASILALYFLCQPDDGGEKTPGWVYLTSLIPKWWTEEIYRYWQSIGAVLFVLAVGYSPRWQWFFNTAVVQYFGKISYALYLMHGPAMHTVGYHFEMMAYRITGVEGYNYNAGFILGALFVIPTVIWWADVFWRAVDVPTVKFAKWFENKVRRQD